MEKNKIYYVNMLSKEKLVEALTYISAYYGEKFFGFEIFDEENLGETTYKFDVWLENLGQFKEEEFMMVVKSYCRENEYPPKSPSDIMMFVEKKLYETEDVDRIFGDVISFMRKKGHEYALGLFMSDGDLLVRKFFKEVTIETVKSLYTKFQTWFQDSSQLSWLKLEFVRAYNEKAKLTIKKNVQQGIIANSEDIKLIG